MDLLIIATVRLSISNATPQMPCCWAVKETHGCIDDDRRWHLYINSLQLHCLKLLMHDGSQLEDSET